MGKRQQPASLPSGCRAKTRFPRARAREGIRYLIPLDGGSKPWVVDISGDDPPQQRHRFGCWTTSPEPLRGELANSAAGAARCSSEALRERRRRGTSSTRVSHAKPPCLRRERGTWVASAPAMTTSIGLESRHRRWTRTSRAALCASPRDRASRPSGPTCAGIAECVRRATHSDQPSTPRKRRAADEQSP